jgi:hypothetical protein
MIKETIENFVDPVIGSGTIRHRFISPETHWADTAVAEVLVTLTRGKAVSIRLNYGSGGHLGDATQAEVAYAISRAFQLAGARLEQLYKEHEYEGS